MQVGFDLRVPTTTSGSHTRYGYIAGAYHLG